MTTFAFAGRCSTEDLQDPEASRQWPLHRARKLIEPTGGTVIAEYFDVGRSRALPWKRRPHAARLLTALRDPRRGFDAGVIGEPQRTFCHIPHLRAPRTDALLHLPPQNAGHLQPRPPALPLPLPC